MHQSQQSQRKHCKARLSDNVRTSGQRLEGCQASFLSGSADVRVTVIEITVSFAAVLHAQLICVAGATVNTITSNLLVTAE